MGKFVLRNNGRGEFYFNLTDDKGRILLISELYKTKDSCRDGIISVQVNCIYYKRFEKKISQDKKHFFNLITHEGQIIGKSESFESVYSMEVCLESVRRNGTSKIIIEE
jgi:uncharacterized protein YegP (UPF0339 family)